MSENPTIKVPAEIKEYGYDALYPSPLPVDQAKQEGAPYVCKSAAPNHPLQITDILSDAKAKGYWVEEFSVNTDYFNFHVFDYIRNNGFVQFDEQLGIPTNKYGWSEIRQTYPVTIGLIAINQISKYNHTSDSKCYERYQRIVAWLLENQNQDSGAWEVPFSYDFFPGRTGGALSKNWASALAQGLCISALCRAPEEMRSAEIEAAVRKALFPFQKPVSAGGVVTQFLGEYPFYEEYPTLRPSLVLNGFMYALLGLHDAWERYECDDALQLFDRGIETLARSLPFYDLGDRSAYDLTHLQSGNEHLPPNPARLGYHDVHVRVLSAFEALRPGTFEACLVRWTLYRYGVFCANN
ncbi:D-glucuronyl C5-epimerase family protein [Kordiimonas sp.]|uniref:D-glucuronyl C5-epimerase family protein n=1 Tax=Kordiimonas sp. TaxID=1970157 RepID=UPI003B51FBD7